MTYKIVESIYETPWKTVVAAYRPEKWMKSVANQVRDMYDEGKVKTKKELIMALVDRSKKERPSGTSLALMDFTMDDGSKVLCLGVQSEVFESGESAFLVKDTPFDRKAAEEEAKIPKADGVAKLMALRSRNQR